MVLATGVAESLHRAYPAAKLVMLVRAGNASVLDDHPFIEVWTWEKRKAKLRNLVAMVSRIRERRFDLVVNLHRFASSGLLTALSGARETRGFDKNPLSRFFSQRYPHPIGTKGDRNFLHETERNHALIAGLCAIHPPRIHPNQAANEQLAVLEGRIHGNYAVVAPASVWFTKQWPASQWIRLIDALDPLPVYLIGAAADHGLAETIRKATGNPAVENLCGKLSLLASALLMKDALMSYVNDSGPLHLCSATHAPVTAVYCSTVPEFGFGPLGEHARVVETETDLRCRPCGLHGHRDCPQKHFKCALEIDPAQLVWKA